MRLDKLIDVSVGHPFGDNREVAVAHCHSQQREHVWVAEGLPCDNFLAERLCDHNDHNNHQLFDVHLWQALGGGSHL